MSGSAAVGSRDEILYGATADGAHEDTPDPNNGYERGFVHGWHRTGMWA